MLTQEMCLGLAAVYSGRAQSCSRFDSSPPLVWRCGCADGMHICTLHCSEPGSRRSVRLLRTDRADVTPRAESMRCVRRPLRKRLPRELSCDRSKALASKSLRVSSTFQGTARGTRERQIGRDTGQIGRDTGLCGMFPLRKLLEVDI